jgi:hypothetical protein
VTFKNQTTSVTTTSYANGDRLGLYVNGVSVLFTKNGTFVADTPMDADTYLFFAQALTVTTPVTFSDM